MASKKNLKKDIDYLITDVILDCYACMEEHAEKNTSEYEEVINEIIVLKEDLLERINHFDSKINGNSFVYFRGIRKDLIAGIKEAYDHLSKLSC